MTEVYVTMLSCSECWNRHDDGDHARAECDCWCHDGDCTCGDDDEECE